MSIHPDPQINRLNVLGEPLASCCFDPITGYFRNGFCHTAVTDLGQHTVCAQMTSEFLNFSSVHDKFHRTLILSGFCLLKIAKISL
ncbi:DUF2237 family protein, partial [Acinetobacter baumannii]